MIHTDYIFELHRKAAAQFPHKEKQKVFWRIEKMICLNTKNKRKYVHMISTLRRIDLGFLWKRRNSHILHGNPIEFYEFIGLPYNIRESQADALPCSARPTWVLSAALGAECLLLLFQSKWWYVGLHCYGCILSIYNNICTSLRNFKYYTILWNISNIV